MRSPDLFDIALRREEILVEHGQKWVLLPWDLVIMTLAERCSSSQVAFHTSARLSSPTSSITAAARDGAMTARKCTKLRDLAVERVADRAYRVVGMKATKVRRQGTSKGGWRSIGTYE